VLIHYVELEGFKSYDKARIEFKPGANAIIGPNGAGKSSILEAIGLALFDFQPAGFKLSGLLREGANSGKVVVGLTSALDERLYEVQRYFSARTTTRYLVYDPERQQNEADNAADVQAWLYQHLKVDSTASLSYLFENTIGVPQGTFTAPLLEARSGRKNRFDTLLQVGDCAKAADALRETATYLDRQMATAREGIARAEGELAALPGREEEARQARELLPALEQRAAQAKEELAQHAAALEALEQAERRWRDAAAQRQQAQSERAAQQQRLEDAERAVCEASEAQARLEASLAGHNEYLRTQGSRSELESKRAARDNLHRRRAGVDRELGIAQSDLARLSAALEEVAAAERRLAELAPLIAEQERIEAELRQAQEDARRLELAQRDAQAANDELTRAEAEARRCRDGLAEAAALERQLAEAQTRLRELVELDRAAREARARDGEAVERLRKQVAALGEAATARCPVCEAELTPEHRLELLERNAQQLQELDRDLTEIEARLKSYAREQGQVARAEQKLQQRLRALPSEGDLRRAEEQAAAKATAMEAARRAGAALGDAPARLEARRQALAALGAPRLEAQRHEALAAQRPRRERERAEAQARQAALTQQLAQLEEELAVFASLDGELAAAQEGLARHRAAHETYLANQRAAQQLAARQEQAAQLARKLAALDKRLVKLEAQHAEAQRAYDPRKHAEARARVADLQRETARAEAHIQEQKNQLARAEREIERLRGLQTDLEARRADLAEWEALATTLDAMRDLLRAAGPYITRQTVQRVSAQAAAYYGDIMDDRSNRLSWSEDYELLLDVKGRQRSFAQFSGGEQMSAALALRLALLREISSINVAFFDEPTAHLDPERRDGGADKILNGQGCEQLFVISHDDTFERVAQHYVRVAKGEGGSRVEEG